ncbi:MAG: hypothetical protein WDN49_00760 [Acetobacteraceae bacterium]
MVDFAHAILDGNERMERYFAGSELRGRIRLGVSEDFVLSGLPTSWPPLRSATARWDLELVVGLSGILYEAVRCRGAGCGLREAPHRRCARGGSPGGSSSSGSGRRAFGRTRSGRCPSFCFRRRA